MEAFVEDLKQLKEPRVSIFDSVGFDDAIDDYRRLRPTPDTFKTEVITSTPKLALIRADHVRYRKCYTSAIFFLSGASARWIVSDLIRRTGTGNSEMTTAEILPIEPASEIHLHLCSYDGGRQWETATDEFFILNHKEGFHQTLRIRSGGFYRVSSVDYSYSEFTQASEWGNSNGALTGTVNRFWSGRQGETSTSLTIPFQWDSSKQRFDSALFREMAIPPVDQLELEQWILKGLPALPHEKGTR